MRWAVWYGDGARRTSDAYAVAFVPALDVQVIAQEDGEHGRILVHRFDFYVWRDRDGWSGVDQFGLWDYLAAEPGMKRVLFGRAIGTPAYQRCLAAAIADDWLPKKSAVSPRELGKPT